MPRCKAGREGKGRKEGKTHTHTRVGTEKERKKERRREKELVSDIELEGVCLSIREGVFQKREKRRQAEREKMFMSKDAFMDVRHSTTTAVHDHDNEKDIDTRRSSVNLDALIVPVPPPPRAHMSSGFENQQQHTTTAPRFRPMPPPAPHSSVGDGGGIAHKPATGGGGGGGSRASQRNYSRSFGMVEDHGKIYDNDLFFGDGGTATPVHDFQKSNTNVSDMDTTIRAKSDILKNTLNQPATRRDQEVRAIAYTSLSLSLF